MSPFFFLVEQGLSFTSVEIVSYMYMKRNTGSFDRKKFLSPLTAQFFETNLLAL